MKVSKENRMVNMECLRILSMFMVVSLHFLGKGGYLKTLPQSFEKWDYLPWILEAFAIVAVNVYVLISGYFLVHGKFSMKRIILIWCQVIFYSILVPIILLIVGGISMDTITIYDLIQYICPVVMGHYWFATVYIMLLFFLPFLNLGIKHLRKEDYQKILLLFFIITSLIPSILPITLTIDNKGYDLVWFVTLYLTAAYIRLYGFSWINSKKRALLIYLISVVGIFLWMYALNWFSLTFGRLEDKITMSYHYNHIFVWSASVGLFHVFLFWKGISGKWGKIISVIAQGSFGIYLLHEHILLRYEWMYIFGELSQQLKMEQYLGISIFIIVLGSGIDFIRRYCMDKIEGKVLEMRKYGSKKE